MYVCTYICTCINEDPLPTFGDPLPTLRCNRALCYCTQFRGRSRYTVCSPDVSTSAPHRMGGALQREGIGHHESHLQDNDWRSVQQSTNDKGIYIFKASSPSSGSIFLQVLPYDYTKISFLLQFLQNETTPPSLKVEQVFVSYDLS